MEELIVKVKDKDKAQMLLQMLSALDFVDSVKVLSAQTTTQSNEEEEFFDIAGIWQDRDITIDSVRQQAWRDLK
jgi:hypothetical protein